MSKMIDGNKLILALSDWWYSSFGLKETDESKAIHKVLDEVERYVEHEKSAGEWIPVSERLPKINTPVMLCGKYNEVIGYRRSDSDWMALSGDGWETDIEHPEDFIAWMPLPEPYREDGEA